MNKQATDKRNVKQKIRINRETLRKLTSDDLAKIDGGYFPEVTNSDVLDCTISK